jgi:hypothetical protein
MCCVQRSGSLVSTQTKTTDCQTVWRLNRFKWNIFFSSPNVRTSPQAPCHRFHGFLSYFRGIKGSERDASHWPSQRVRWEWVQLYLLSPPVDSFMARTGSTSMCYVFFCFKSCKYVKCLYSLLQMLYPSGNAPCFQQFLFFNQTLTTLSELFCGLFMSVCVSVRVSTSRFTKGDINHTLATS